MDSFGSEIGQKMRSAVKAKLLELGTGGTAGYIDDELPDYVMIMVANKRSKQQMIADLNLFLGSQTELFVTWLHEVLQKLQEVTLPAVSANTKKRKVSQKEETGGKKDKKASRKEKKSAIAPATAKKPSAEGPIVPAPAEKPSTSSAGTSVPVINSITDVFADVFLEKAKKTLDTTANVAAHIKKVKVSKVAGELNNSEPTQPAKKTNEFNIPTISEISSTTDNGGHSAGGSGTVTSGNREKDLAELAEIQKKIYVAKKHLKQLGEINDQSDDEDFLNLKDDGSVEESSNEDNEAVDRPQSRATAKPKSPIVFNAREQQGDNSDDEQLSTRQGHHTPPPVPSAAMKTNTERQNGTQSQKSNILSSDHIRERERDRREPPMEPTKRPVHERLGLKPSVREVARGRRLREDKALYVPTFRRNELKNERDKERDRERERERDRDRNREDERRRGERERDRERAKDRQPSSRDYTSRKRVISSNNRRSSPMRVSTSAEERQPILPTIKVSSIFVEVDKKPIISSDRESSASPPPQRQRIGSRVIVAPLKQVESSDEEEEKPVNSVIKIKPRPPVSPSKQACKNLLLRAVAEAQRSTILTKPKAKEPCLKLSARLSDANGERNTKLYTKSFRNRLKRSATVSSSSNLFRRSTQNLVIEVESDLPLRKRLRAHVTQAAEEEEYVPESVSDRGESDIDYVYVPQTIRNVDEEQQSANSEEYNVVPENVESNGKNSPNKISLAKTQFVVTLNDEKTPLKFGANSAVRCSRSVSPIPQVSSSSSVSRYKNAEASSTTHTKRSSGRDRELARRQDIKSRLSIKSAPTAASSSTATRASDHESSNSLPATPPPPRRSELIEIYRKPKDIKKIIIKNDSEDEDMSPKKSSCANNQRKLKRSQSGDELRPEERSTTPPNPPKLKLSAQSSSKSPPKRKRTPINFEFQKSLKERDEERGTNVKPAAKRRSKSGEREREREREREYSSERHAGSGGGGGGGEERRKISIRNVEARKYDNIPSLNSLTLDSAATKVMKPKERCKYHPNCTKQFCDFYHPTAPCKSFPNCKFADKCLYSHPKCKYDLTCTNIDCNYSHSGPRNSSLLQSTAPPLSSHVVPVQNYKSISVSPAASTAMCKYYPNCTKVGCSFYHPKPCRFGKNCINKLECNFYHHEVQSSSKFKWVAAVI